MGLFGNVPYSWGRQFPKQKNSWTEVVLGTPWGRSDRNEVKLVLFPSPMALGPQLRGAELVHGPLKGPQPTPRFAYLLLDKWVGEVPWYMLLDPTAPTRHFCP